MDIFSINTSTLFNLLVKINPKERDIIIDPISCLIKLSILSFYPSGTKISISNNMVSIIEPGILQGAFRFFKGDNREDLHNLYVPIIKSIEWYWDEKTEIKHLFNYSIIGLQNLRSSYPKNSTITHTLDLYIHHLITKQTKTFQNKEIEMSNDDNMIHEYLKKLWNPREIHIVIEMLLEYDNKRKTNIVEQQILNSILDLTMVKEKKLTLFLKEHLTTL